MGRLLVSITGRDSEAMLDLTRKHRINIIRQTAQELSEEKGFCVDSITQSEEVEKLRRLGYQVTIKEDIDAIGRMRQNLVGKGDRFLNQPPKK